MPENIFSEVEKQAESTAAARASWRGVLSLDIPSLGLGAVEYHLRAAKAHGDQRAVSFLKIDRETGKEVIGREVPVLYRYRDGPSGERLQNYVTWVNNLKSAGIVVIGYTFSSYAGRSISSVEADFRAYRSWYGVQGVFVDQMANWAGDEWYYSTLNSYAKSLG